MHIKPSSDPEVPFAGFTICPEYNSAYKNEGLVKHRLGKNAYRGQKAAWYNDSDQHAVTLDGHNVYRDVTHGMDEVLRSIYVGTRSKSVLRKFDRQTKSSKNSIEDWVVEDMEGIKIITKYHHTFGRCYCMEIAENIKKLGITAVSITTKMDVNIWIEHPGQHMFLDSRERVS